MDLRDIQLEELNILREFCRVCEALNLRYYVTAGTLLGAVRHRGFIPWDDDIDIAMPREDYDRLSRHWREVLSPGYTYQDYRSEPNFPYYFAKVRKKGTYAPEPLLRSISMEQGYYIDIFPLDICPDSDKRATAMFQMISILDCGVLAKVCPDFVCGYEKKSARAVVTVLSKLPLKFTFALREWGRKLLTLGSTGQRLCTVGGQHGFPRETYQAAWFEKTALVDFEGQQYPAPGQWHQLLTQMYGDYMTPPEKEQQTGHLEEIE